MPARKKSSAPSTAPAISLRGARQHNLKGLDLDIPLGKLTVVTGPSGSGKSSLAFHTLYAEGQRRYVETFSPYVRQFFDRMDKPAVDKIEGIPPAIAIEQKNSVRTTRSTVGTLTEINDYLKLLYARLATGFDPHTGEEIRPDSPESAADWAAANVAGQAVMVTFPVPVPPDTKSADLFPFLNQQGYLRLLQGGNVLRTDEPAPEGVEFKRAIEVIQDRVTVSEDNRLRLLEALETAFHLGKGHAAITVPGAETRKFSTGWTNPHTGFSLRAPSPSLFSFNNPLGACPKCRGFGRIIGIDLDKAVPDPSLSIKQGAIKPFQGERGEECQRDLLRHCKERRIDIHEPWEDLDDDIREWIYYGDRKTPGATTLADTEELWRDGKWYGVKGFFDWLETKAYKMHVRVFLSRYRSYTACPECRGKRLQPESLCFKIDGKALPDLWTLPVSDLRDWFSSLITAHRSLGTPSDPSLDLVLNEITSRLHYLGEVGLGYLTLDRPTRTLSGGEVERVNLTTCLGASLTGTLFVLDEPTVGLHPRDIHRLVGVMHGLRDKGNTLVVVEHEEAVMRAADEIIDLGPASGEHGGTLLYQGPVVKPAKGQGGTLPWLGGGKSIALPAKRRQPGTAKLEIRGATKHNLKKLDADIPLGLFCCLTGVSGSGKSTFVHDILYLNLARKFGKEIEDEAARVKEINGAKHLGGIELVDQSPVARTPRSTPAVFMGAFDPIRQLFALTEDAKARELNTGFFSFNSGEGRCDRCAGVGSEKVEMQFLSDLYVTCPDCNGRRYKASTLDITYRGKSVADILELTVDEAIAFYTVEGLPNPVAKRHGQITGLLQPLAEVGLGYLKLGQPLNTLSGGEAQRLKLCQLLAETKGDSAGSKLLILDEPTTGLHFTDIERLLAVFQRLVDSGHSLLVIEHNLDVIKCADWILDLGPEAGANGGQLVGDGPPEHIATLGTETARFLKDALAGGRGLHNQAPVSTAVYEGTEAITLSGARHHNLKNISLEIPREKFVVLSGLSGSGKSTLAFDILFAEGQRRFLDSMSAYARQFAEQLEKPEIDRLAGLPPTVAIEQRVSQGGGKSTVATVTELWNFIRLLYSKLGVQYCPDCQVPVEKQSLAAIENTLRGHLKKGPVSLLAPVIRARKGFHTEVAEWALKQGFTRLLVDKKFREAEGFQRLERFKEHDIDVVVADFPKGAANTAAPVARALDIGKGVIRLFTPDKKFVLLSSEASCPCCHKSYDDLDPRLFSFNSPHGWCLDCRGHGLVPKRRRHLDTSRFDSVLEAELDADRTIERMEDEELVECPSCHGARLNRTASAVHLQGTPIRDVARLAIDHAAGHFGKIRFTAARDSLIARDILPEIKQRLAFLQEVGLGYLQLDRSAKTLSGGESQRIRLAAQLGSNLRGVLYVLDEPTIGLHPRDNAALLNTLVALRDKGNSLIVVEHDEDTIARADHLIDLGPGAGRLGGQVVYQGKPPVATASKAKKLAHQDSPTWRALSDILVHPMRGERRAVPKDHPRLTVTGCRANNLKDLDIHVPLGRLTVLTGISGSGKSTLMHSCLAVAAANRLLKPTKKNTPLSFTKAIGFDKIQSVYEVDQSPIGKTSRSCPATYVKVFDDIRALYAQLPEARMRGFEASRFSFNTEGGRCTECNGNGRVKLEMDFLPPTWVHCEGCNGNRYNPATLEVTFRDKNIGDVLAMTIDEAAVFFESQPRIARPLRLMADTGLGYLQLGQASPTLSGGEAQRIKLISEIAKGRGAKTQIRTLQSVNKNLYLIEEPTVGLHLEDVKRLIDVLHRLVDEGHTVVVIEHHMAVAAEADHVIDLGPEAGENGGTLIAEGTPEQVAKSKKSRTAPFLKAALSR
ncbi:excinuclease ABC subunit UvrA [Luteolibacter sp. LG18]|uniref:excinuclease ABC subunit UvrA n=1 Tax=Luteolibacter sp. LG18 TaxID=2819286 RepID=UPI002B2BCDD5|nr:UvrABC system protein A [Luteolibacter sp. LG18]